MKYNLRDYLLIYLNTAIFPSKSAWKAIVHNAVSQFHNKAWEQRTSTDREFKRFSSVQRVVHPSVIWTSATSREQNVCSFSAIRVLVSRTFSIRQICRKCNASTADTYRHIIAECPNFIGYRRLFLNKVASTYSVDYSNFLRQTDPEMFLVGLFDLNLLEPFVVEQDSRMSYLNSSFAFIHNVLLSYK